VLKTNNFNTEDYPKATRYPEQLLFPLHENADSPLWLALSRSLSSGEGIESAYQYLTEVNERNGELRQKLFLDTANFSAFIDLP
jgi:hypothetical protein